MSIEPGEAEICVPRMTRRSSRAVDSNVLADIADTTNEPITKSTNPYTLVLRVSIYHQRHRLSESHAKRHRKGAGAEAVLLAATEDLRLNKPLRVAADAEAADPLRAVNLVRRQAEKVDVQLLSDQRSGREGLYCVYGQKGADLMS